MTNQPSGGQSLPPSFFASLGHPSCSRWGKTELECIALAYVQALAADGDTWKPLTRDQVCTLLTDDQMRGVTGSVLWSNHYQGWFDAVAAQITDADGAWGVGGFWHKGRIPS